MGVVAVKSGSYWVTWANTHAKNSTDVEDLRDPFKTNAKAFIKALEDAGATIAISTTFRSEDRAYLFHWCWLIGLGKIKPSEAKKKHGVDIQWDHGDDKLSIAGAKEMIKGFGLAVPPHSEVAPSLYTNHKNGDAIDMAITWDGDLHVLDKKGTEHVVPFMKKVNLNKKLHRVGATYGVKKLTSDAPHWSATGH
jgi:hypothetical protein